MHWQSKVSTYNSSLAPASHCMGILTEISRNRNLHAHAYGCESKEMYVDPQRELFFLLLSRPDSISFISFTCWALIKKKMSVHAVEQFTLHECYYAATICHFS